MYASACAVGTACKQPANCTDLQADCLVFAGPLLKTMSPSTATNDSCYSSVTSCQRATCSDICSGCIRPIFLQQSAVAKQLQPACIKLHHDLHLHRLGCLQMIILQPPHVLALLSSPGVQKTIYHYSIPAVCACVVVACQDPLLW